MNKEINPFGSEDTSSPGTPSLYNKTAPYDEGRIRELWHALLLQAEKNELPAPDGFPVCLSGHGPIARFRDTLIDDIGLGMQFRWNLIVATLKTFFLDRCNQKDRFETPEILAQELIDAAGFPAWFKQLGNVGGTGAMPLKRQLERAEKVKVRSYATDALEEACRFLNSYFGDRYRQVASSFKMTPDKLKRRHFGERSTSL